MKYVNVVQIYISNFLTSAYCIDIKNIIKQTVAILFRLSNGIFKVITLRENFRYREFIFSYSGYAFYRFSCGLQNNNQPFYDRFTY